MVDFVDANNIWTLPDDVRPFVAPPMLSALEPAQRIVINPVEQRASSGMAVGVLQIGFICVLQKTR